MNGSLSLTKIISGLSNTMSIARQIIPIYKEVKPMLEKSSEYLSKLNKPTNSKTLNTNSRISNKQTIQNSTSPNITSKTTLKFFQ